MNERGFTLIEVIIALAIFTVGLLAVAALQGTGLMAAGKSEQMTQSKALAKSEAERLIALGFDHDDLRDRDGDGKDGLDDTNFDDDPATLPDADYGPVPDEGLRRTYWNVAEDHPDAGLKTVRVITVWTEKGASRRTVFDFLKSSAL